MPRRNHVRTAQAIPDNERWLPALPAKVHSDLDKERAELSGRTKRSETDLGALARKIKRIRKVK